MNLLLEKLNEYKSITNYSVIYTLENNDKISFKIDRNFFPHLIGLHKLIDIPIITRFNDKNNHQVNARYLYSKILHGQFNDNTVKNSSNYNRIADRYDSFSKDNLFTILYTDVVVDFDASLVGSGSLLKSKYILFNEKNNEYNHLCIAEDSVNNKLYMESFFHTTTDLYIRNQNILKIKSVQILDNKGEVYLEDTFIQDPPTLPKSTPTVDYFITQPDGGDGTTSRKSSSEQSDSLTTPDSGVKSGENIEKPANENENVLPQDSAAPSSQDITDVKMQKNIENMEKLSTRISLSEMKADKERVALVNAEKGKNEKTIKKEENLE